MQSVGGIAQGEDELPDKHKDIGSISYRGISVWGVRVTFHW